MKTILFPVLLAGAIFAVTSARPTPAASARAQKVCGPVCAIYCPFGNVLDGNGCPTCRCKPPSPTTAVQAIWGCGPPALCFVLNVCPFGHQLDSRRCPVCDCIPLKTVQEQTVSAGNGVSVDRVQLNAKAQHNMELLMKMLLDK